MKEQKHWKTIHLKNTPHTKFESQDLNNKNLFLINNTEKTSSLKSKIFP